MIRFIRRFAALLLLAAFGGSPIAPLVLAQQPSARSDDKSTRWPTEKSSIVSTTSETGTTTLSNEPVMRIALSTGTSAATISTTAQLLSVSEFSSESQPVEAARVRVESRMLTPTRVPEDRSYEVEIARSLSREEADRLTEAVRQAISEQTRVTSDGTEKWRVVISKPTKAEADDTAAKLDDAGFEILSVRETSNTPTTNTLAKSLPASGASAIGPGKVKLTARPTAPSRELVAFARGTASMLRSSAPLIFASSDEKNAPVRFNDKPFRGKIEVFANAHGSVTVVNVIGLEDYVRGVVPNELSYPALEALKAQAIAARTYAVKNRGQFAGAAFAPFMIKSSRELFEIKDERDLVFARDAALLSVNGFALPGDKISSSWLSSHVSDSEAGEWLTVAARIARNVSFKAPEDITRVPRFSTALVAAVFGEGRADTLLNSADVDYLLSFRDASEIPAPNRADVAMLLRDGALSLFAGATLRPKDPMSRAYVLHAISHLLEARNLLALQKGTTRPAAAGLMMLRSNKGKDQPVVVSREAFLFRAFGENLYQLKSLALVGGEPVTFHVNGKEGVDYLEVRPAPNGASPERFSSLTNWTAELSLGAIQSRLARSVRGIGSIIDLRVDKRGSSRRVIDLEVIGTQGVGHIRGGRIRSALGLKEQLFVIDRLYNEDNRVTGFVFTGRGWGHGVGMCQFGAYGLAKQGYTVEQILKTYYTGIELTKMY